MKDLELHKGQMKAIVQTTGTRADVLEVNTLMKMKEDQNTPHNGLTSACK